MWLPTFLHELQLIKFDINCLWLEFSFSSQSISWILFFFLTLKLFCNVQLIRAETSIQYSSQVRAIVHDDHQKIVFLFMLLFIFFLFLGLYILYIYYSQNKINILGLTRQHKIAWKSGRKFILKFSPQADFNFVQPC